MPELLLLLLLLLFMRLLLIGLVLFIATVEFPDMEPGPMFRSPGPEIRSSGNSLVKSFNRFRKPSVIQR